MAIPVDAHPYRRHPSLHSSIAYVVCKEKRIQFFLTRYLRCRSASLLSFEVLQPSTYRQADDVSLFSTSHRNHIILGLFSLLRCIRDIVSSFLSIQHSPSTFIQTSLPFKLILATINSLAISIPPPPPPFPISSLSLSSLTPTFIIYMLFSSATISFKLSHSFLLSLSPMSKPYHINIRSRQHLARAHAVLHTSPTDQGHSALVLAVTGPYTPHISPSTIILALYGWGLFAILVIFCSILGSIGVMADFSFIRHVPVDRPILMKTIIHSTARSTIFSIFYASVSFNSIFSCLLQSIYSFLTHLFPLSLWGTLPLSTRQGCGSPAIRKAGLHILFLILLGFSITI
ncbi:hypothetical protein BJ912DRAFT_632022 [Pholiota molesta]|nr:hypothetical protein BJ912DRAFT_632022 [Pholiota molesta]